MKTCKKITEGIAKVAEWIVMAAIAGLVIAIVLELVRRNFFNQSFAGNIQHIQERAAELGMTDSLDTQIVDIE